MELVKVRAEASGATQRLAPCSQATHAATALRQAVALNAAVPSRAAGAGPLPKTRAAATNALADSGGSRAAASASEGSNGKDGDREHRDPYQLSQDAHLLAGSSVFELPALFSRVAHNLVQLHVARWHSRKGRWVQANGADSKTARAS
eukprot:CAMPEP_0171243678 /NCGR_PEP_ID=MMETSP0790-20130122/46420_1 /TAXON_ID=2925 /ORGANISM="Alexandrium catenella, Strain OF101" /LENGTH=147 /DNA_ID=CAMNT_0011710697 /DNA_START=85 /DNA_END=526 /DNA_ORIENTATION=+